MKFVADVDGEPLPLAYFPETACWGMNWDVETAGPPQTTLSLGNQHPGVQDVRLTVGNHRDDGSRACITVSGPTDHVTMAFGGPRTGGLGPNFGVGNQGQYAQVFEAGVPFRVAKLDTMMGELHDVIASLERRIEVLESQ